MRKEFLFIFYLFLTICANAQDRPIFFPEDVETPSSGTGLCLCKPGVINKSNSRGVELTYMRHSISSLRQEDDYILTKPYSKQFLQLLNLKIRFPIVNKPSFKIIGGLHYRPEKYQFRSVGAEYQAVFNHLDGQLLKSSGFELLTSKSWNEKFYTLFRVRALFNGDYNSIIKFDNDYSIYNASGLFGIKKTSDKEIGIGVNFSHSFRSSSILPFVVYNKTFNNSWGIEMVLPALINIRYNASPKLLFLGGIRYNSRSYRLNIEELDNTIYHLNHSEIRTTMIMEKQLTNWVWLDATIGYQFNFSTDFNASNNPDASFQVKPGMSPFIKFGVFISPPNSVRNK